MRNHKNITHADITSERHPRGGIVCVAMVHHVRVSERYFGYTMREARQAFYRYCNAN